MAFDGEEILTLFEQTIKFLINFEDLLLVGIVLSDLFGVSTAPFFDSYALDPSTV